MTRSPRAEEQSATLAEVLNRYGTRPQEKADYSGTNHHRKRGGHGEPSPGQPLGRVARTPSAPPGQPPEGYSPGRSGCHTAEQKAQLQRDIELDPGVVFEGVLRGVPALLPTAGLQAETSRIRLRVSRICARVTRPTFPRTCSTRPTDTARMCWHWAADGRSSPLPVVGAMTTSEPKARRSLSARRPGSRWVRRPGSSGRWRPPPGGAAGLSVPWDPEAQCDDVTRVQHRATPPRWGRAQ